MPVIFSSASVAAGATNNNLFSGSAFEFARTPQLVSVGVTVSATGGFGRIQNGSDIIAEEFSPFVLTTPPVIPDHMYFSDYSAVGDRLIVAYRNPTGGAITINSVAQISPVG
jgi:hypothetical protein